MDPGLWRVAGHHFEIDLSVVRQLVADGHSVRVYTHHSAVEEVTRAFSELAETVPLFRVRAYENPARMDPIAGELLLYERLTKVLSEDLSKTAAADLWLWPSIFAGQLNACATAGRGTPVAGCVHTEPAPSGRAMEPTFWRHAFLNAQGAGLRLRIGGIEPEHRHAYLPITADEHFDILPIPHEGKPIAEAKTHLRTIGFFGHQRGEKGAALLPALLKRLLGEGYEVVVQDSSGALRVHDHPGLHGFGYVADLPGLIARCDLVVLPYVPEHYRIKGSGILWESLATGVPVVAPFATAPGNWIERTGAGKLFAHATEDGIHRAVAQARNDYARIAAAAFGVSRKWSQVHSVANFVRALLQPVPAGRSSGKNG